MVTVPQQTIVGIGLILVGSLLFIPGVNLGVSAATIASLILAAALLVVGTLLVGTSEPGRTV